MDGNEGGRKGGENSDSGIRDMHAEFLGEEQEGKEEEKEGFLVLGVLGFLGGGRPQLFRLGE